MRLITRLLFSTILIVSFASCDEVNDVLNAGLTDDEIVQGLKEALTVGTDSSVTSASAVNGYLSNQAIKILLPPEIQTLKNTVDNGSVNVPIVGDIPYQTLLDAYVLLAPNIETDPFDELITAMNRGAESAAVKAKPIFIDAITGISITDGLGILQGGETAATDYFRTNTSTNLVTAFTPDVSSALGDTKALAIYSDLVGFMNYSYNYGLGTVAVSDVIDLGVELPESIEGYATERAVDGLFHLVGEEEKQIRADPFKWASDILRKVFGSPQAGN
ncbi:MAG: DUF4197 domain-containing protein [Fulvivirga sp.]|uniref:DUF4197 domain-containing protein n=1 Tax=Fulvivirga sp. TaxID=1931237 RepID=UPI0032EBB2E8